MLKLIGTLRNGSSRLGSRTSTWCISNHQMVSQCSSVAAAAEIKDNKSTVAKSDTSIDKKSKSKYPMVQLVFETLEKDDEDIKDKPKELDTMQKNLKNLDRKDTTGERRWMKDGKIKFKDLKKNPKSKSSEIVELNPNQQIKTFVRSKTIPVRSIDYLMDNYEQYENVSTIPVEHAIKIMSSMVAKHRRVKPLLQAISTNICNTKTTLSIKNVSDILYNMTCLNFPETDLLQKLCDNLQESVKTVQQSPIIGSILTSMGMMRYRNDLILNTISEWAVEHKSILRTQDLCAMLMTFATVGFNPTNSDVLIKELVSPLKETDMIKPMDWLNLVWALTILNQVTPDRLKTVLNEGFCDKLADPDEIPIIRKFKLLNINAVAKYLMNDYSGPYLPDNSPAFDTSIVTSKNEQIFMKAITDSLANLFPSREHFRINVKNDTGFLLDAEFFIDEKCAPLPVDKVTNETNALRIAVVANIYNDYCIGEKHLLGPVLLHYRLLQAKGYRILDISNDEFHIEDKLLKRITYINDRIKSIVK